MTWPTGPGFQVPVKPPCRFGLVLCALTRSNKNLMSYPRARLLLLRAQTLLCPSSHSRNGSFSYLRDTAH